MEMELRELYNRERLIEDRLIRSKDIFEQERMQKALRRIRSDIGFAERRIKIRNQEMSLAR